MVEVVGGPGAEVWVNIESSPIGAGTTGEVVYSTDGGASWSSTALSHNGITSDHDWWHANLGGFSGSTTIRYAVKVVDGDATEHWDNNGGSNYVAEVNAAASSIRWFGNSVQAGAARPVLGLGSSSTTDAVRVQMDDLASNAMYTVMMSHNLMTWSNVASLSASEVTEYLDLATTGTTNGEPEFYRVRVDWVPAQTIYDGNEAVISIETWPIGGATAASIIYQVNGGGWTALPMHHTGTRGDNDVWTVSLGTYPIGTAIKYAIEVIDEQSESQWDNNSGSDYQLHVRDPNVTDFEAPTTSYSPQNTVTTNATLDVTLSASDNMDPSPTIYYTTNGSEPTTGSTTYSTPIEVTDQGSGIDMTIKFFAQDATGNTSGVTTIEVKVNNTFSFGPTTPYSTNPTLGQGVANGSITADGVNNGEWDDSKLIALDMANDDPRSYGDNWTMHEAAIDMTHLWAAWDDNNLYLAWQYVDVTDIIDPANAGSSGSGKISNNDGILQWIAIDTGSGGATLDVWGKNNGADYWTGTDLPDVQIYMAGSLWQGYISRAVDGVFPVDDGGVNYFSAAAAGITYGKGDSFQDDALWGVGDADNRNDAGAPSRNFIGEGHSTSRDSFYEIAIPLSTLQITRSDIENDGIGVLMGAGSESCMDSLPHDETTINTPGTETYNSSFEWGDTDSFTTSFARVGAGK